MIYLFNHICENKDKKSKYFSFILFIYIYIYIYKISDKLITSNILDSYFNIGHIYELILW